MKPENLTAWALNELSAEEQARLQAELSADPAVQESAKHTKEFCSFLTRELRDDSLALTPEQRAQLFKTGSPKVLTASPAFAPQPLRWWQRPAIPMAAAAGIVVGGLLTTLYMLPLVEQRAQEIAAAANKKGAGEVRVTMEPAPRKEPTKSIPANLGLPPASMLPGGKEKVVEGLLAVASNARDTKDSRAEARDNRIQDYEEQLNELRARITQNSTGNFGTLPPGSALQGPPSISQQIASLNAAEAPENLLGGGSSWLNSGKDFDYSEMDITGGLTYDAGFAKFHDQSALTGADEVGLPTVNPFGSFQLASAGNSSGSVVLGNSTAVPASPPVTFSGTISGTGSFNKIAGGNVTLAGTNTYTGGTVIIADPTPASRRKLFAADSSSTAPEVERLPVSGRTFHTGDQKDNFETYTKIVENPLISVAREPLSTFSIDVDTASYANVRRFLNQNTQPPRDAVRLEELINYFPTSEVAPAANSKEPFAVKAEMAACPWQPQHRLVRIHLKGRDVPTGDKASNLVFLVDVSGSMDAEEKLPLVQRSLRMLAERLEESDHVSLVTYAGGTQVVLPSTNGLQKAQIMAAIDGLQAGGSTHGSAGIKLAYEQAVKGFIKGGVNRVMLCTDGDFNVGLSSPKELEGFIAEKARSGVFLSVLGFGTGNLKDKTMETLADKGNGNYAYIDSVSEARKVLVEQMQGTLVTIAKDVKIQVEFNPAIVREYRLIGYENRLLAKEDFNDDTKDAGEIGAGHCVTALYELVPANLPPGTEPSPVVDNLKYQTDNVQLAAPPPVKALTSNKFGNEALTIKLRYKEPEGTTSKLIEVPLNDDARGIEKAGAEFKFTAAVAGFGMLLRESGQAGSLTWDVVRQLAREGKGSDPFGYRGEFLQLIEKAAAGK